MADQLLLYVLSIAWTVLSTTPAKNKNRFFALIFPIEAVFQQIAATVSITFAPGLWEILEAATPPTIANFKTLRVPLDSDRVWDVYLLILQKPQSSSQDIHWQWHRGKQDWRSHLTPRLPPGKYAA
jgi:hypothetical protein